MAYEVSHYSFLPQHFPSTPIQTALPHRKGKSGTPGTYETSDSSSPGHGATGEDRPRKAGFERQQEQQQQQQLPN